jgi:hypothetical protein
MYRRNVKLIIGSLVFNLALAAASFAPMTGAQGAEGTLRGTVTEAGTGARLGGVSVQAFCWQVVGSDPGAVCGATQTATDGTYSLSLTPGTYKVIFDHWPAHRAEFYGGGTSVTDARSLPVDVPGGGSAAGIGAALVPLRAITGTVTGNGAPVGGIHVTAYQLSSASGSWEPAHGTVRWSSFSGHEPLARFSFRF